MSFQEGRMMAVSAQGAEQFQGDGANALQRLNRVAGQVEGVKQMVSDDRSCTDIVAQLRAIRAAVRSLEANLLEDHLRACVTHAFQSQTLAEKQEKINEVKNLYRRYDD